MELLSVMASSASSYSVGNRIYKGGTNAPTRGTVDPMGYIERELNMASNSRSGLAAAALRRMSTNGGPSSGTGAAPNSAESRSLVGTSGVAKGVAPGVGGGNGVTAAAPPLLRINQVGRLQAPDLMATAANFQPSFNPEAADATVELQSARNKFNSEFTRGQQGLERDYVTKTRSVQDEIPVNQSRLLEDYAGRGVVHSSGYAQDQTDLQANYAKMLAMLAADKTAGESDLLSQQGQFNDDYSMRMTAIQQAAARKAAEELATRLKEEQAIADAANADVAAQRAATPTVGNTGIVLPDGFTNAPDTSRTIVSQDDPTQQFIIGRGKGWGMDTATQPVFRPVMPTDTAPVAAAPVAPATPKPMAQTRWEGPIDAKSRAILAKGGTVTRSNGYVYQMSGPNGTGVPVRIR